MKLEYNKHPNSRFPYPHIFALPEMEPLSGRLKSQIIEQLEVLGPYYTGVVNVSTPSRITERFRWVVRDNCIAIQSAGDATLAKLSLDL